MSLLGTDEDATLSVEVGTLPAMPLRNSIDLALGLFDDVESKSLGGRIGEAGRALGGIIDSLGRHWNADLHPRDSRGRFVETGGIARMWGGGLARVTRALGGGYVQVKTSDGAEHRVLSTRLTMVRRPDGGKPTASKHEVLTEDARRVADAGRGDGHSVDDHGTFKDLTEHPDVGADSGHPEGKFKNGEQVRRHWQSGGTGHFADESRDERRAESVKNIAESAGPITTSDGGHFAITKHDGKWQVFHADTGMSTGDKVATKGDALARAKAYERMHDEAGHPFDWSTEGLQDRLTSPGFGPMLREAREEADREAAHDKAEKIAKKAERALTPKPAAADANGDAQLHSYADQVETNRDHFSPLSGKRVNALIAALRAGDTEGARNHAAAIDETEAQAGAPAGQGTRRALAQLIEATRGIDHNRTARGDSRQTSADNFDARVARLARYTETGPDYDRGIHDELATARRLHREGRHDEAEVFLANAERIDRTNSERRAAREQQAADGRQALLDAAKDSGRLNVVHVGDKPKRTDAQPYDTFTEISDDMKAVDTAMQEVENRAARTWLGDVSKYAAMDALRREHRDLRAGKWAGKGPDDVRDRLAAARGATSALREQVDRDPAAREQLDEPVTALEDALDRAEARMGATARKISDEKARNGHSDRSSRDNGSEKGGAGSDGLRRDSGTALAEAPADGVRRDDTRGEDRAVREPGRAGDRTRAGDGAEPDTAAAQPDGDHAGQLRPAEHGEGDRGGHGDQGAHPVSAAGEPGRADGAGPERTGPVGPADGGNAEDGGPVGPLRRFPGAPRFQPHSQADLAPAGTKAKAKANIEALRVLRQLQEEDRPATPAEQKVLARWAGWGALAQVMWSDNPTYQREYAAERGALEELLTPEQINAARQSAINAHYTDAAMVESTWAGLKALGFDGGSVLEPGSGAGTFMGFAPDGVQMVGVEKDPITAAISQALYPDALVNNDGLEDFGLPNDVFDAAIGNVPFAAYRPFDKVHAPKREFALHNFAIIKAIRQTKPGGVVALFTSNHTLDSTDKSHREAMFDDADLIGAVRLPSGAHQDSAGTKVVTDLLLFRKRLPGEEPTDKSWLDARPIGVDGEGRAITASSYFVDHPEHVLGDMKVGKGLYSEHELIVEGPSDNVGQRMRPVLEQIGRRAQYGNRGFSVTEKADPADIESMLATRGTTADGEGRLTFDGTGFKLMQGGRLVEVPVPKTQQPRLRKLLDIRDAAFELLQAERETDEDTPEIRAMRTRLNKLYDAYVAKHKAINDSELTRSAPTDTYLDSHEVVRGVTASELEPNQIIRLAGYDAKGKPRRGVILDHNPDGTVKVQVIGAKREADRYESLRADASADVIGHRRENRYMKRKTPPALDLDPLAGLVTALESYDPENNLAKKGSILKGRSLRARKQAEHIENPDDAISTTLDEAGGFDLDTVAKVMGTTPEDALARLGGRVFKDPSTGRLLSREEYRSGDVRKKLREAQRAAIDNPEFQRNVDTLNEVVPEWMGPDRIKASFGASWIGPEVIQQFLSDLLDDKHVSVKRFYGSQWKIEPGRKVGAGDTLASQEWGTADRDAYSLVDSLLHRRTIRIVRTDPDGSKHLDLEATAAANDRAEKLRDRFQQWLWEDGDRADQLLTDYNDNFNGLVARQYSNEPMRPEGMSETFTLMEHQSQALRRGVNEPSVLIAHEVGAGKTLTAASLAMELRRLGHARKPMITVPDHMKEQWQREFLAGFPQAKVLAISSEDLSSKGRAAFLARVATGDWDAVIITHSAFAGPAGIKMSKAAQRAYIDKQMDAMRRQLSAMRESLDPNDKKNDRTIKQMEKRVADREQKLREKLDKPGKDGLTFEHLGVDYLIVDEAHEFKNLERLSNTPESLEGSDKASDLDMKLDYLRETNTTGRYTAFLTATPISNSMGEVHTMLKYLRPDLLEASGINDFDTFLANFAKSEVGYEMKTDGSGFEAKERLASFYNMPGLLRMWLQAADVMTADDLDLDTPDVDGDTPEFVIVPQSDWYRDVYGPRLVDRAMSAKKNRAKKGADNILVINTDGKAAALDPRMVGGPRQEGSKLDVVADKVKEIYEDTKDNVYDDELSGEQHERPGGLQLIFLDQGTPGASTRYAKKIADGENKVDDEGEPIGGPVGDTVGFEAYEELKQNLIDRGIPAEKIGFMHDAKGNDAKKAELFRKARSGELAVLVGSTGLMGVGTNVQARAVALHHVDCPYRPSDIQQRTGRALRQKNQNSKIRLLQYATEGSLETRLWNGQKRKARLIEQVMKGDLGLDEVEEFGTTIVSAAEMEAEVSGNKTLLEKVKVDAELKKARLRKVDFEASQRIAKATIQRAEQRTTYLNRAIEQLDGAIGALQRTDDGPIGFTYRIGPNGETPGKRVDANAMLRELGQAALRARAGNDREGPQSSLGFFGGLEVVARGKWDHERGGHLEVSFPSLPESTFKVDSTDVGSTDFMARIDNHLSQLHLQRDNMKAEIPDLARNKANAERLLTTRTYDGGERLNALEQRAKRLDGIIRWQAEQSDGSKEPMPADLRADSPEVDAILGPVQAEEAIQAERPAPTSLRNVTGEGTRKPRVNAHLTRKAERQRAASVSGKTAKTDHPETERNPLAGQRIGEVQTRPYGPGVSQVYETVHGRKPGETGEKVLFTVQQDGRDFGVFAVGEQEARRHFTSRGEAEAWAIAEASKAPEAKAKPGTVIKDPAEVARELADIGAQAPEAPRAPQEPAAAPNAPAEDTVTLNPKDVARDLEGIGAQAPEAPRAQEPVAPEAPRAHDLASQVADFRASLTPEEANTREALVRAAFARAPEAAGTFYKGIDEVVGDPSPVTLQKNLDRYLERIGDPASDVIDYTDTASASTDRDVAGRYGSTILELHDAQGRAIGGDLSEVLLNPSQFRITAADVIDTRTGEPVKLDTTGKTIYDEEPHKRVRVTLQRVPQAATPDVAPTANDGQPANDANEPVGDIDARIAAAASTEELSALEKAALRELGDRNGDAHERHVLMDKINARWREINNEQDDSAPPPPAFDDEGATAAETPAPPVSLETHDYEGRVGDTSHITRTQKGTIPTSLIATLPGARGEVPGEHRNRQGERWQSFLDDIKTNGIKNPVFITVEPNGEARLSEGNHRRDAAVELGMPETPVEIRYFGHGERNSHLIPDASSSDTTSETVLPSTAETEHTHGDVTHSHTLGAARHEHSGLSGLPMSDAPAVGQGQVAAPEDTNPAPAEHSPEMQQALADLADTFNANDTNPLRNPGKVIADHRAEHVAAEAPGVPVGTGRPFATREGAERSAANLTDINPEARFVVHQRPDGQWEVRTLAHQDGLHGGTRVDEHTATPTDADQDNTLGALLTEAADHFDSNGLGHGSLAQLLRQDAADAHTPQDRLDALHTRLRNAQQFRDDALDRARYADAEADKRAREGMQRRTVQQWRDKATSNRQAAEDMQRQADRLAGFVQRAENIDLPTHEAGTEQTTADKFRDDLTGRAEPRGMDLLDMQRELTALDEAAQRGDLIDARAAIARRRDALREEIDRRDEEGDRGIVRLDDGWKIESLDMENGEGRVVDANGQTAGDIEAVVHRGANGEADTRWRPVVPGADRPWPHTYEHPQQAARALRSYIEAKRGADAQRDANAAIDRGETPAPLSEGRWPIPAVLQASATSKGKKPLADSLRAAARNAESVDDRRALEHAANALTDTAWARSGGPEGQGRELADLPQATLDKVGITRDGVDARVDSIADLADHLDSVGQGRVGVAKANGEAPELSTYLRRYVDAYRTRRADQAEVTDPILPETPAEAETVDEPTVNDTAELATETVADGPAGTAIDGESYAPTGQQQSVYDAVLNGQDVKVQAGAGSGKTSTLEGLARRIALTEPDEKIAYVAFNKSVQVEAEGRMPGNVEPRTGHSIAFQWATKDLQERTRDKAALRRPDDIASHLRLTSIPTGGGEPLSRTEVAMAAVRTVDTFANSADDTIGRQHLPERLRDLPDEAQDELIGDANRVWDDLRANDGRIRLTLDHLRKMWALSRPDFTKSGSGLKRPATILFLDEAQDTPPVLAKVVSDQNMRKVIVGDQDQAIYGFTGAIDYLDTAQADTELPLTKSWRYGPQVADIGNRFLQMLGSKKRVIGGGPDSRLLDPGTMNGADAILVRSNGGAIAEIIREQDAGRLVGVPKGTKADLTSLVETARYLKGAGRAPSRMHDDLAPFRTWDEVSKEADKGDDPKIAMLHRIVEQTGVDHLDQIVQRTVELGDDGLSGVTFRDTEHGLIADGKTFGAKEHLKDAGFRFMEVPGERDKDGKPVKRWVAQGTPAQREAKLAAAREAANGPKPDVVVSTAHKAKGLEWDRVRIGDDFKGPKEDPESGELTMPSPEELRLAYVAVTRAKNELDPGSLAYVFQHTDTNGQGHTPEPTTTFNERHNIQQPPWRTTPVADLTDNQVQAGIAALESRDSRNAEDDAKLAELRADIARRTAPTQSSDAERAAQLRDLADVIDNGTQPDPDLSAKLREQANDVEREATPEKPTGDVPSQVDGYTLRSTDAAGTYDVLDTNGISIGQVKKVGKKYQTVGADGREHAGRDESAEDATRGLIGVHEAHQDLVRAEQEAAAMTPADAAAREWDNYKDIVDTGHFTMRTGNGDRIKAGELYVQHAHDFIARNPDRDSFITGQTAGRDALLANTTADGIDVHPSMLRVGDRIWTSNESQGAKYGWHPITDIGPGDHGNGTVVAVGTKKPRSLHIWNDTTALINADTARRLDGTPSAEDIAKVGLPKKPDATAGVLNVLHDMTVEADHRHIGLNKTALRKAVENGYLSDSGVAGDPRRYQLTDAGREQIALDNAYRDATHMPRNTRADRTGPSEPTPAADLPTTDEFGDEEGDGFGDEEADTTPDTGDVPTVTSTLEPGTPGSKQVRRTHSGEHLYVTDRNTGQSYSGRITNRDDRTADGKKVRYENADQWDHSILHLSGGQQVRLDKNDTVFAAPTTTLGKGHYAPSVLREKGDDQLVQAREDLTRDMEALRATHHDDTLLAKIEANAREIDDEVARREANPLPNPAQVEHDTDGAFLSPDRRVFNRRGGYVAGYGEMLDFGAADATFNVTFGDGTRYDDVWVHNVKKGKDGASPWLMDRDGNLLVDLNHSQEHGGVVGWEVAHGAVDIDGDAALASDLPEGSLVESHVQGADHGTLVRVDPDHAPVVRTPDGVEHRENPDRMDPSDPDGFYAQVRPVWRIGDRNDSPGQRPQNPRKPKVKPEPSAPARERAEQPSEHVDEPTPEPTATPDVAEQRNEPSEPNVDEPNVDEPNPDETDQPDDTSRDETDGDQVIKVREERHRRHRRNRRNNHNGHGGFPGGLGGPHLPSHNGHQPAPALPAVGGGHGLRGHGRRRAQHQTMQHIAATGLVPTVNGEVPATPTMVQQAQSFLAAHPNEDTFAAFGDHPLPSLPEDATGVVKGADLRAGMLGYLLHGKPGSERFGSEPVYITHVEREPDGALNFNYVLGGDTFGGGSAGVNREDLRSPAFAQIDDAKRAAKARKVVDKHPYYAASMQEAGAEPVAADMTAVTTDAFPLPIRAGRAVDGMHVRVPDRAATLADGNTFDLPPQQRPHLEGTVANVRPGHRPELGDIVFDVLANDGHKLGEFDGGQHDWIATTPTANTLADRGADGAESLQDTFDDTSEPDINADDHIEAALDAADEGNFAAAAKSMEAAANTPGLSEQKAAEAATLAKTFRAAAAAARRDHTPPKPEPITTGTDEEQAASNVAKAKRSKVRKPRNTLTSETGTDDNTANPNQGRQIANALAQATKADSPRWIIPTADGYAIVSHDVPGVDRTLIEPDGSVWHVPAEHVDQTPAAPEVRMPDERVADLLDRHLDDTAEAPTAEPASAPVEAPSTPAGHGTAAADQGVTPEELDTDAEPQPAEADTDVDQEAAREAAAEQQPAEEPAQADEPGTGAEWVNVGHLNLGDTARISGTDDNGQPATIAGYVTDPPTPVLVGDQWMLSITLSDNKDGSGAQHTVRVATDALSTHASNGSTANPESDQAATSLPDLNVLHGRLAEQMPLDPHGRAVFPGSIVDSTEGRDADGLVAAVAEHSVTVQWPDKRVEQVAASTLTVTDDGLGRPHGWTADGHRIAEGQIVSGPGIAHGTVIAVDGDQVSVGTPSGTQTVNAEPLHVLGSAPAGEQRAIGGAPETPAIEAPAETPAIEAAPATPPATPDEHITGRMRDTAAAVMAEATRDALDHTDLHALREQIATRLTPAATQDAKHQIAQQFYGQMDTLGADGKDREELLRRADEAADATINHLRVEALRILNNTTPHDGESQQSVIGRTVHELTRLPESLDYTGILNAVAEHTAAVTPAVPNDHRTPGEKQEARDRVLNAVNDEVAAIAAAILADLGGNAEALSREEVEMIVARAVAAARRGNPAAARVIATHVTGNQTARLGVVAQIGALLARIRRRIAAMIAALGHAWHAGLDIAWLIKRMFDGIGAELPSWSEVRRLLALIGPDNHYTPQHKKPGTFTYEGRHRHVVGRHKAPR